MDGKTTAETLVAVIYHAGCSDGFGGAYAAWKKFGEGADYIPLHHTDPLPVEKIEGKEVYCIDFSYDPGESLDVLLAKANKVVLIDHHISTQKIVDRFSETHFATDHSGAVLAWQYFHPHTPVPKVLERIESRDLGWLNDPEVRETDRMLSFLDSDFVKWDHFVNDFEDEKKREQILRDGALIERYAERQIARFVSFAEEVTFEGHKCLMVNASNHVTYIGQALSEKMPPIGIIWSRRGKQILVSLRSDGTVDVAAIAEKYGGGGHKQAAAFAIEKDDILGLFQRE